MSDKEELAKAIAHTMNVPFPGKKQERLAESVLASDWLARHDAQVKAAALHEAAVVIEKWADAAREIPTGELWNPADVAEDLQVVAAEIRRTDAKD